MEDSENKAITPDWIEFFFSTGEKLHLKRPDPEDLKTFDFMQTSHLPPAFKSYLMNFLFDRMLPESERERFVREYYGQTK